MRSHMLDCNEANKLQTQSPLHKHELAEHCGIKNKRAANACISMAAPTNYLRAGLSKHVQCARTRQVKHKQAEVMPSLLRELREEPAFEV